MNRTDFLICLKLQKGVGYIKCLQIASQLDDDEVNEEVITSLTLPGELTQICLNALSDEEAQCKLGRIKQQCTAISFFDDLYPEKLRQIYRPPLVLFARGDITLLKQKIVAIVGARQAGSYSQDVINKLVPNLIAQDLVIASGLAKGADVMAHKAALMYHGKTIAVVGNGLNHCYPAANHQVQDEIIKAGLLLSEYLPDTPPRPFRFPERNRILAGLAQSVVVTEAKKKSGSLITANLALQENRDVYAVPGPITSELSAGPNQLIEAGANPIVDFKLKLERFDN